MSPEAGRTNRTNPVGGEEAAGEEPRKPALSPSRALDFKKCPLLYRFRAIDRLPELPSPAQVRGTLVHAVLERLFDLPAAGRTPEAARALVEPEWKRLAAERATDAGDGSAGEPAPPGLADLLFGAAQGAARLAPASAGTSASAGSAASASARTPAGSAAVTGPSTSPDPDATPAEAEAAWLASADALLDAYFALEDPRTVEPAARELLVETETASGVPLRGYLDRLDVSPAGELRIIDYKTGLAPGEAGEAGALFQMKFYALALLRIRGVLPAQLRLYYLGDGQVLHYSPEPDELARFGQVLDALWAAIQRAAPEGDFRPNPGPACEWCDHRALCPAWDGVPPPYPGWPTDGGPAQDRPPTG